MAKGIRTEVYLRDTERDEFLKLREEIRQLYFKKYGESLSLSNVLMKSLKCFKDFLESEELEIYGDKRKNLHKYERIRK